MTENKKPICNVCGESLTIEWDTCGLVGACVKGGYNSTPGNGEGALDDCSAYEFSICEFCLDWIFSQCRVPPKVHDYHDGTVFTYRPAHQRVQEDAWREMKPVFYAEAARRAALRKKS